MKITKNSTRPSLRDTLLNILILLPFAWAGAFGMTQALMALLPVTTAPVEILDREHSIGTEGDDFFYMTVREESGSETMLSVPEWAFEDLRNSPFNEVLLQRSMLLGKPTALAYRSKSIIDKDIFKDVVIPGATAAPAEKEDAEPADLETYSLLTLGRPMALVLWGVAWAIIVGFVFYYRPSKGRRNIKFDMPEMHRGPVLTALGLTTAATLLWS